MRITSVSLTNWRNFVDASFDVDDRLFVIGANAVGKSNLLDALRFLSDIARPETGLTRAVTARGGFTVLRSLFTRNREHGRVVLSIALEDGDTRWEYRLALSAAPDEPNKACVAEERVIKNDDVLLQRPSPADEEDPALLTQTHLEQLVANRGFSQVVDFLARITYLHPVPQMIRHQLRAPADGDDAFGGSLIARIADTPPDERDRRLAHVAEVLRIAVPGFETLALDSDELGAPHLVAGYRDWRPSLALQRETEFSDGTLRLIDLLWTLTGSRRDGLLLLEEPELSLNPGIVRHLAEMLSVAVGSSEQQVIVSTHAPLIVDAEGVDRSEVLLVRVGKNGSTVHPLSTLAEVRGELDAGFLVSEVTAPMIRPDTARLVGSMG